MQYSATISVLFATAAIAAPTLEHRKVIATRGLSDLWHDAKGLLDYRADGGCEIYKCAVALAPASALCAATLAEIGANPLADAGCVLTALNIGVDPPEVCTACLDDSEIS